MKIKGCVCVCVCVCGGGGGGGGVEMEDTTNKFENKGEGVVVQ